MVIRHHIYKVDQRVLIKSQDGGLFRPPSEGAKGTLGLIAPQLFQDWPGTFLEREPDVPPEYYVTVDNGITETISEDWLELAPPGSPPPPEESKPWPT
ncbi:MAG: hypothetical protein J4N67_05410 [Chloroflexi bacterium]|nr:hypothetical protein [Chloroflexota bacterium]MCI0801383.1 hypothetical protein [Chloroflexota bacterium]MCI0811076.1 hypothetical protein [Chloroflexota bacterium]MCI0829554.1 hypothetical protein [Chloroflexota bacterium]MCI0847573.1 hypothetical protein [Chloroflexota bacterium]